MYSIRRKPRKFIKLKHKLIPVILSIALVLSFALPAIGQDIISVTHNNINSSQEWWDQLWESTFNPAPYTITNNTPVLEVPSLPSGGTGSLPPPPPIGGSGTPIDVPGLPPISDSGETPVSLNLENNNSLSLYAFVNPTRFILAIGLIAWLFSFGFELIQSKTIAQSSHTFIKLFIPIFIALLFLANQATYSRNLAYGMRGIIHSWSDGVMNLQITDYSVREALQDGLITNDAKQLLSQKYLACQQMPKPEVVIPSLVRPDTSDPDIPPITPAQRQVYDYLECLDQLTVFAQERLDLADAERECSGKICRAYKSFLDLFLGISAGEAFIENQKRLASESPDQASIEKLEQYNNIISSRKTIFDFSQGKTPALEALSSLFLEPSDNLLYFTQWMWISRTLAKVFYDMMINLLFD